MNYDITRMPKRIILGYVGESNVTIVEIDCGAWLELWPTGDIVVTYQLPDAQGAFPLPAEDAVVVNDMLSINITQLITHKFGVGTLNIRLLDGEVQKRSAMVECIVLDSHSMEMLPSQEYADWLSEARNFLDTVEARLDNIDFAIDANGILTVTL